MCAYFWHFSRIIIIIFVADFLYLTAKSRKLWPTVERFTETGSHSD